MSANLAEKFATSSDELSAALSAAPTSFGDPRRVLGAFSGIRPPKRGRRHSLGDRRSGTCDTSHPADKVPSEMGYGIDLRKAARRHQVAATLLDNPLPQGRPDVAAYLFGVAAECALKELMWQSGMRPQSQRRDDPFFMHFPHLKTALRDTAHGRLQGRLLKHAMDGALLSGWDVTMRYARTADVLNEPQRTKWRPQAEQLIQEMEEL